MHLSPQQSALVLWGLWTLAQAVFFSIAGFYHRYYLSMLAPGIAALAGVGVVLLWRDYRSNAGWQGWLLPLALVFTAFTQAVILADYTGWNSWMTPLVVGGSLVIAGVLVWYRFAERLAVTPSPAVVTYNSALVPTYEGGPVVEAVPSVTTTDGDPILVQHSLSARMLGWGRVPLIATTLGVALLLVGPTVWTGVSLASGAGGTLPAAGPTASVSQGGFGGPGGNPAGRGFGGPPSGGFGGPRSGTFTPPTGAGAGQGGGLTSGTASNNGLQVDSQLISYLEAHQGSAKYLFATISSQTAAPYIIATGEPVMTLGGFSGSDQILTLAQLKTLIVEGQVKYFMLDGGGGFGGGAGGGDRRADAVDRGEYHASHSRLYHDLRRHQRDHQRGEFLRHRRGQCKRAEPQNSAREED